MGFKERYRLSLDAADRMAPNWPIYISSLGKNYEEEFDEDDPCSNQKLRELVECFKKPCQEAAKPISGK